MEKRTIKILSIDELNDLQLVDMKELEQLTRDYNRKINSVISFTEELEKEV